MRNKLLHYAFVLGVFLSLTSCKDDDDPAPSPVVGKWVLDRVVLSGFPADLQGVNGQSYDPGVLYNAGFLPFFTTEINVNNGSIFNQKRRAVLIEVTDGTWTFNNNELSLRFDGGTETRYAFDTKRSEITGPTENYVVELEDDDGATVRVPGRYQLIFEKAQ